MSWHSVEQIAETTYLISEPLGRVDPRIGVDTVNMFLLVGEQKAALVDSGMGIGDVRSLIEGITRLPCEVLNTHYHWDHVGANARFADSAIHGVEGDLLDQEQRLGSFRQAFRHPADPDVLPASFCVDSYRIRPGPATRLLADGDVIDLGGRSIEALHTPGHSPGHVTYLDGANGLLFTGDTAYHGPVFACFEGGDPEAFAETAARLAGLPGPVTVCPGHNSVIRDRDWLTWYARCVRDAVDGRVEGVPKKGLATGREFVFDGLAVWLPL